jgi:transposase
MARAQKEPLRPLSPQERHHLEEVVRASSERVDRVRRARALLAVAATRSFAQAARQAGFRSVSSVANLVARFNARGLAAVQIAPGRGRRPTYDQAARAHIVAVAQQQPRRREDQTATWSLSTLQRRLRAEGLPQVGRSTIRRVLQAAGSSYQRTRTWCPTGTAQRKRKTGWVQVTDPQTEEKRALIEAAYRWAEGQGIAVWCQDEAGPYQAIPQPGACWAPQGQPLRQPHEYVRGGTAKLLTLFRPATGIVRAKGVISAPNAVLHPWLRDELRAILATLPGTPTPVTHAPFLPYWWRRRQELRAFYDDPPVRLILIWDNLAGHKSPDLVCWLCAQGILPLYTPLSGSWLNMAESLQRIIADRALDGHHPQTAQEIISWLEDTVAGWNQAPTAFVWDGKRRARRRRAPERRLGGSAAILAQSQLNAA